MIKTSAIINLFVLIMISTFISPQALAENPTWEKVKPNADTTYKKRVQNVETLLEKSSATKQIDSSGSTEARAQRDVAKSHFEKAQQAYAAGDLDAANNELTESTKIMFEAVRLAKREEFTEEKKKHDYQDRLDSINALMKAHERVSEEKGKQAEGKQLKQIVADKIKTADLLLKEGDLDKARSVLDEAYVTTKMAISGLRGGDTLVRTLHFETKEEEYLYEIDRNDTHKMLLQILSKDNGKTGKMTKSFLDKAAELRKQAEQQASAGDHEAAIKTLEVSTKNLVRAMRGSGVYIPG